MSMYISIALLYFWAYTGSVRKLLSTAYRRLSAALLLLGRLTGGVRKGNPISYLGSDALPIFLIVLFKMASAFSSFIDIIFLLSSIEPHISCSQNCLRTSSFSVAWMLLHETVVERQTSLGAFPCTVHPNGVLIPSRLPFVDRLMSNCRRASGTFAPMKMPTSLQSKFDSSTFLRFGQRFWCCVQLMNLLLT